MILYRGTLRQEKVIKTQHLQQEEVKRFAKENRALTTTVYSRCCCAMFPANDFLSLNECSKTGSVAAVKVSKCILSLGSHIWLGKLASKSTHLLLATKRNEKVCINISQPSSESG